MYNFPFTHHNTHHLSYTNLNVIDEETSKAITGVRFVLIVFVVFMHNVITEVNFATETVSVQVPFIVNVIRTLISTYLGAVAVPLFFFISGYILFFKNESYMQLLRKKGRSIMVPYIIWNLLVVLVYGIAQTIPLLKPFFATYIVADFGSKEWLEVFIGRKLNENMFYPLVYQFWFLRELIICIFISPIIKIFINRSPFLYSVFIIILLNSNFVYGGLCNALFYFSLGAFAVKFKFSYKTLNYIKFWDISLLYAFILALEFYFYFSSQTKFVNLDTLNNIVGGLLLLKISGNICHNEKIYSMLKYLASFSFWLYATHEPIILNTIKKLWTKFLPINGYWLLLEYFGGVLICISISLCVGILIKKCLPKLFAILTGGR